MNANVAKPITNRKADGMTSKARRTKSLNLTVDEWDAIEEAAVAAHMSMHGWIRAVVTVALGKSELPAHIERIDPNVSEWKPGPEITGRIEIPHCEDCDSLMNLNEEFGGKKVWCCAGCGSTLDV